MHDDVSGLVDIEERKVIFATSGKDAPVVERLGGDLPAHHAEQTSGSIA